MIVLDTDIVTLFSYGRNEKLRQRIEAVPEDEELAVTVITQMEILQGRFASIQKAATGDELLRAMERFRGSRELIESFLLLEINAAAAQRFTAMTAAKKRPKVKRGDMLIACIALAHDALLVTQNVKDYKPVNGLQVENWAE